MTPCPGKTQGHPHGATLQVVAAVVSSTVGTFGSCNTQSKTQIQEGRPTDLVRVPGPVSESHDTERGLALVRPGFSQDQSMRAEVEWLGTDRQISFRTWMDGQRFSIGNECAFAMERVIAQTLWGYLGKARCWNGLSHQAEVAQAQQDPTGAVTARAPLGSPLRMCHL